MTRDELIATVIAGILLGLAAGLAAGYRHRLTRAQARAASLGERLRAVEHHNHDLRRQYTQVVRQLDSALIQLDGHPYREAEITHLERLYATPSAIPPHEWRWEAPR